MWLGHPSSKILNNFLRLHNLPVTHISSQCIACVVGKSKKQSYYTTSFLYTHPLELVQIDVRRPSVCSSNGHRYYMSIVDSHSRYTWIYFMQKKSDVARFFVDFHRLVKKKHGHSLKAVQFDGEGEFHFLSN